MDEKKDYVGQDCPMCKKKGTLFRCPKRSKNIREHDLPDYVCVNCTMSKLILSIPPDEKTSRTLDSEGCTSGVSYYDKGERIDPDENNNEYWKNTPEISKDLYDIITDLWIDSNDLKMIRRLHSNNDLRCKRCLKEITEVQAQVVLGRDSYHFGCYKQLGPKP